jgi:hypothetical protein
LQHCSGEIRGWVGLGKRLCGALGKEHPEVGACGAPGPAKSRSTQCGKGEGGKGKREWVRFKISTILRTVVYFLAGEYSR